MEKPDKSRADWSNYWQGRSAGQTGEVFAGAAIETSEELATFWRAMFEDLGRERVMDLACGAGSALKHAPTKTGASLIGLDISEHAIAAAKEAVPSLLGITGRADQLPLAGGSLDRVVSQFGFEYADSERAAMEISRVLKPGGRFVAIAHMAGGAIARECEGNLHQLQLIERSRFIPATRTLFSSLFEVDRASSPQAKTAYQVALKGFQTAQAAAMPAIRAGGLGAHLHGGARQLFERRRAYAEADIMAWLAGMEGEIAAYRGRMAGMLDAALTEAAAQHVVAAIVGGPGGTVAPFSLGGAVAAYRLEATKPA